MHQNQVSMWKCQAMDGLGAIFSNGADKALVDREVEVHDLHAKIGHPSHAISSEHPARYGRDRDARVVQRGPNAVEDRIASGADQGDAGGVAVGPMFPVDWRAVLGRHFVGYR